MGVKKLLTGIKPTGELHLGNYVGSILPTLDILSQYDHAQVFIADYHALNALKDPHKLRSYTYDLIATYLACGLDPKRVTLYRQSDIPEVFELATMLMSFTEKGLMNRAHAYKARVEENLESGKHADEGVNMGLYTYPVLMAADILLFAPDVVPVGKDQIQHIEMARDIAQHVNSTYGEGLLHLPTAFVKEEVQTVVGLDGRKMSKSYGNTIPLFGDLEAIRKAIMKIPTTSQGVEEPKDPDTDTIFTLYSYITSSGDQEALRAKYVAGGMGWGEAKTILYDAFAEHTQEMRKSYASIREDHTYLHGVLAEGAAHARSTASATIQQLRRAIGIDG